MKLCLLNLWRDESGAVLSAELVLIMTLCVLALVVGLNELASAVNCELFDIAYAIRNLNQSYAVPGFRGCWPKGGFFAGSRFVDFQNFTCLGTGFCGNGVGAGAAGVQGYGYYNDVVPGVVVPGVPLPGQAVVPTPATTPLPATPCNTPGCPGYVPGPAWQPVPGSAATPATGCPSCPPETKVLTAPSAPATGTPTLVEPAPVTPAPKAK